MATFFIVLALLFFAGWVFAEFKAGKGARLALGVACIALLFVGMAVGHMETAVYLAKTNMRYKDSLALIAALIERDRAADIPPVVVQHLNRFQRVRDTQSYLSVACDLEQELWQAFRALDEETDDSTQEK